MRAFLFACATTFLAINTVEARYVTKASRDHVRHLRRNMEK